MEDVQILRSDFLGRGEPVQEDDRLVSSVAAQRPVPVRSAKEAEQVAEFLGIHDALIAAWRALPAPAARALGVVYVELAPAPLACGCHDDRNFSEVRYFLHAADCADYPPQDE